MGVGKLGWHGNSTGFDKKKIFFFPFLRIERKTKDTLTSLHNNGQPICFISQV